LKRGQNHCRKPGKLELLHENPLVLCCGNHP
jgi:hypothetical protein